MTRRLSRDALLRVVQSDRLDDLTAAQVVELFRSEQQLQRFVPDGKCQVDPRDGAVITYSSARARRPHDYAKDERTPPDRGECPICEGNTTGVIDVAALSDGFTFINKNLFPVLYLENGAAPDLARHEAGAASLEGPAEAGASADVASADAVFAEGVTADVVSADVALPDIASVGGMPIHGLHLLQWTSSLHDRDFHNMPLADLEIVLERLARLEDLLLSGSEAILVGPGPGHVLIIKNYGPLVGGSLAHGHQQIALSSVMPRRFRDNAAFEERHGEVFSAYMLRENPDNLTVRDYGPAVLVVPYFMRRPYDMMLLMRDTRRRHLSEFDAAEISALAQAWQDATRSFLDIMPRIGREPAYNVTVSSGPGAGLYVEFLPYTQETGGLEHLGLWACQNNSSDVAEHLRAAIGSS